jgi:hypothetical protein
MSAKPNKKDFFCCGQVKGFVTSKFLFGCDGVID